MSNTSRRKAISESVKRAVLRHYENRCANNPSINFNSYKCPMWLLYEGYFDDSGFEYDHIEEYSITKNNDIENIQVLCHSCHAVKTKKYLNNKCLFTSVELQNGAGLMDVDKLPVKKRIRSNTE